MVWSMDEFIKHSGKNTISGKHVVLTFDDIDTTLPRNIVPTLCNLSISFAIFVITGKAESNLDGEQLKKLQSLPIIKLFLVDFIPIIYIINRIINQFCRLRTYLIKQ
ncbi:polysaccharide deacetylase family protein [Leuconostoc gelidum]|uniref:polysaccharide deacetylase family protein n=2 Tax=Leuconostoc gelidum TaxID=1244 RepID=UPI0011458611